MFEFIFIEYLFQPGLTDKCRKNFYASLSAVVVYRPVRLRIVLIRMDRCRHQRVCLEPGYVPRGSDLREYDRFIRLPESCQLRYRLYARPSFAVVSR